MLWGQGSHLTWAIKINENKIKSRKSKKLGGGAAAQGNACGARCDATHNTGRETSSQTVFLPSEGTKGLDARESAQLKRRV
jgi:hypothetical protein